MKALILKSVLMLLSFSALSQPGALDESFGIGGKVLTNVDQTGNVTNSALVQPDGKIVVIGYCTPVDYEGYFTLVRYNSNGTPDVSFGVNGTVTTIINGNEDIAFSGVIQADGKILAGGYTWTGTEYDFAMVRYNIDGTRDLTFGTGGIVTTDFDGHQDKANQILIQSNGDIVMVGHSGDAEFNNIDMALARYHPNGSLDQAFGNDGLVVIPVSEFGGWDVVRAAALQADGKIVVAGFTEIYDPAQTSIQKVISVLRLQTDGSLDLNFGSSGIFTHSVGEYAVATSIAVAQDGKVVVLAETKALKYNGTTDFAILRLTQTGTIDTSFGTNGLTITSFDNSDDTGSSLILQPDGKILAAGYTAVSNGSTVDFALARYNADGFLDNTFGSGGKVTVDFQGGLDFGGAIALHKNGKIVMAGTARVGNDFDFGLVRFENDAALPVRLVAFNGRPIEDQVLLEWQTSSEINSQHFEIHRSFDAVNWSLLGTLEANHFTEENITYSFTDPDPSTGRNYYRLKMVDFDQSFTFSSMIAVDLSGLAVNKSLCLYPNPTAGQLKIRQNVLTEASDIRVFNSKGVAMTGFAIRGSELDLSSFPIGLYTVSIMSRDGRVESCQVLLER